MMNNLYKELYNKELDETKIKRVMHDKEKPMISKHKLSQKNIPSGPQEVKKKRKHLR